MRGWSVAAIGKLTGWLDYPIPFVLMGNVSLLSIGFVARMPDRRVLAG